MTRSKKILLILGAIIVTMTGVLAFPLAGIMFLGIGLATGSLLLAVLFGLGGLGLVCASIIYSWRLAFVQGVRPWWYAVAYTPATLNALAVWYWSTM